MTGSDTGCIPIVDLSQWFGGNVEEREQLAKIVNRICHEIGFFYIINHGISQEECDRYMDMLVAFFDLPETKKQALDKSNSPQFRGWEKLGSELTNNEVDYREQLDIGTECSVIEKPEPYYMALIGPNQWPEESLLPGFRNTVLDFVKKLSELSKQILAIMSLSLGLKESHIADVFGENPSPYTKLIRYPKTVEGGNGVGTHKDSGFLTLLLQDDQPGLEAQSNQGEWLKVNPLPGSLVVNTGELLQLVTHNYFIATPHRVVNNSGETRHSSAFFYSPDLNTCLDPLPISQQLIERAQASERHRNEGLMASRAEMAAGTQGMGSKARPSVFGDKYWQRWIRSYPEIASRHYPEW